MKKLIPFLPATVLGLLMLAFVPFFIFVIFLGGDSCCGENTSGNMLLVTAVISTFFLIISIGCNLIIFFFVKFILSKEWKISTFLIGSLITWILSSGIYWPYVLWLIWTAFYA